MSIICIFSLLQFELDKMSDEVDNLNKKLEEERALRETVCYEATTIIVS